MAGAAMKRGCFVVSSVLTLDAFMRGHLGALTDSYEMDAAANCADKDHLRRQGLAVGVANIPILREVSPLRDLAALVRLVSLFRGTGFDSVHSVTPKAGLLAMVAAKFARVGVRIHTFTGQVWATKTGLARAGLKALDRVTAACATHVLVDSSSQLEFLVKERVLDRTKATVLGHGSISGVDTKRFQPDAVRRQEVRACLGTDTGETLFLFVGRLKRDKGVLDLAEGFARLAGQHESVRLLFVGPDEEDLRGEIERRCQAVGSRVSFVAQTAFPEHYMVSADVFCLPSYREGFGSVVIEAAACEVPAIASRIYGVTDAVDEGKTGLLHEPGNVEEIRSCMQKLHLDRPLRERMGKQGRERAKRLFEAEDVTKALVEFYAIVLGPGAGAERSDSSRC